MLIKICLACWGPDLIPSKTFLSCQGPVWNPCQDFFFAHRDPVSNPNDTFPEFRGLFLNPDQDFLGMFLTHLNTLFEQQDPVLKSSEISWHIEFQFWILRKIYLAHRGPVLKPCQEFHGVPGQVSNSSDTFPESRGSVLTHAKTCTDHWDPVSNPSITSLACYGRDLNNYQDLQCTSRLSFEPLPRLA